MVLSLLDLSQMRIKGCFMLLFKHPWIFIRKKNDISVKLQKIEGVEGVKSVSSLAGYEILTGTGLMQVLV
jgi:hypothetical protein